MQGGPPAAPQQATAVDRQPSPAPQQPAVVLATQQQATTAAAGRLNSSILRKRSMIASALLTQIQPLCWASNATLLLKTTVHGGRDVTAISEWQLRVRGQLLSPRWQWAKGVQEEEAGAPRP